MQLGKLLKVSIVIQGQEMPAHRLFYPCLQHFKSQLDKGACVDPYETDVLTYKGSSSHHHVNAPGENKYSNMDLDIDHHGNGGNLVAFRSALAYSLSDIKGWQGCNTLV